MICYKPRSFSGRTVSCGRCVACGLIYAREKALRCSHESEYWSDSSFVTLTYSDECLKSPKLQYEDFQLFMKRLRHKVDYRPLSFMVTGEYGSKNYRPHWHAIIFGYKPSDGVEKEANKHGDVTYESAELDDLWKNGRCDFGSVTERSAGYVARYGVKALNSKIDWKLYKPKHVTSKKLVLGQRWIRDNWRDVLNVGCIRRLDNTVHPIPRYYKKWIEKNFPKEWEAYENGPIKKKIQKEMEDKRLDLVRYYKEGYFSYPVQASKIQEIVIHSKNKVFKHSED